MSYYGNDQGGVALTPQVFTGAGSAAFTLSPRIQVAQVYVNKVLQVNNYTIVGNTLTFDSVIPTGYEVVVEPRNALGRQDVTNYKHPIADQTGSSTTAYTATFTPANGSLIHNTILGVKLLYTNTSTTPTFSPDGITAKTIVNTTGGAILVGQLVANTAILLRYDETSDKWWLVLDSPWGSVGSDIASATTLNLTSAGVIKRVTGTTATTGYTINIGQRVILVAVGAWPLTYHSTNNPLPGSISYTCVAGDVVIVSKDGNSDLHIEIVKRDGTASASSVEVGSIIDFAGSSAPVGYLACNGAAVSRSTYVALFNVIGVLWGVGDGSTTFNVPNFSSGEASVQSAGTVGASTDGVIPAHVHTGGSNYGSQTSTGASGYYASGSGVNTGSFGTGTKNLAAGKYVLKCVKY